jgi:hypothetical protein
MRFTIENTVYQIVFRYETRNRTAFPFVERSQRWGGNNPIQQKITTVTIKEPGDQGKVVATAEVARHYKDRDDRDMARKAVLRKALASMDVSFRTAAWKAYHTRPGGLWATQA